MKWVLFCAAPALAAGGIYLHDPSSAGETYPLSVADVEYTLGAMSLPDYVENTLGTLPGGNSTRTVVPGKSVTYYFHARGGDAGKFTAELSAVDATHTRVTTSMTMNGGADELMKTKYLPVGKEFGVVGRDTMREQIDARLERRPFDKEVTKKAMAGFAVANMGAMMKSTNDVMDDVAKMQENRTVEPAFVPGPPIVEPVPSR